jgi:small-conductance mechanosensitive channel
MLLMALLVIYLSIQASWVLQATLETQVFPYSSVDRGVRDAVKKLLHYFLIFLGFLLAMGLAGIELRNFAVLAGAFGIGIGFGLQNIVNNFVSGLILLFERPVKVGDQVVVDEDWGRVISIGLRSTVIETFDGSELIVPNSLLISEKVTNWTLSTTKARIVLPVGVAYGSDLEVVLRILKEVAESHPLTLSQPPPSPIFVGFGDSSLDFELRCWIADVDKRLDVRSDLGRFIDGRFREGGVEIPFPQRDLHLRSVDGEILGRVQPEPTKDGASPHPINS